MNDTVMRVVDKAHVRRYVGRGGCRCIFCGSEDITGGNVDIDDGGAAQDVLCDNCGGQWMDVYVLSGVVANGCEYAKR